MLTHKQHQMLMFIHDRLTTSGISPSFEEMKDAIGLKSKSGIHRLITALEERGFISRLPNRARALEVIKMPDDMRVDPALAGFMSVPLIGRIAAGTPIEALRESGRTVDIPMHLIGMGDYFALEVTGDSMTGVGILDGDTALIKCCETAEDGDIVVALIDSQEVMLKRLARQNGQIALRSANPSFETKVFPPARVKIQGKLAGLIRKY